MATDVLELPTAPSSIAPTTPGWYVVWEAFSASPQVVWWQSLQRGWRCGASVLRVVSWAGPLPASSRAENREASR